VVASLCVGGIAHAQDPCDSCREPPRAEAAPVAPAAPALTMARPRKNVLFRYELGPVYTHALSRNLGGMRFDLEVGGDLEHFTVGARFGAEVGGTQSGLPYQRISWGLGVGGRLGRVRLGVEPRFGFITIVRASDPHPFEDLIAGTVGLHGECVIALLGAGRPSTRDRGGLDFIVRAGYDYMDVRNGRVDAANTIAAKIGLGGRY
jgi:hypothetical protein